MWNTAKIFLLCISFVFIGCDTLVSFEYLDLNCSVAEGDDYFSGEYIRLDFSQRPDRDDTEKHIQLTEDTASVPVDSYWDGSSLFLRPRTLWQKGQHYSLTLETTLRMEDNRTYTVKLLRSFIYGEPGNKFELASGKFESGSLVLIFSKPPVITSFNEKFSLSPFTDYHTDFIDGGKTVIITPKNGWQVNTSYTWLVRDMVSSDGYLMKKEYSGAFSGLGDIEIPRLTEVCAVTLGDAGTLWHTGSVLDGALMEGQGIGFVFSKPMDEASVRSGLSFYPSLNGYLVKETDRKFIFIPDEMYQIKKEYRLTISETVKDTSGTSIYEPELIFFMSTGRFLTVNSINLDDDSASIVLGGIVQNYTLLNAAAGLPLRLRMTINFSSVIPQPKRRAAADSISLTSLFPASAANPILLSAVWFDSGSRLVLDWERFTRTDGVVQYYYQIKITGGRQGAVNQAGEYLEEGIWAVFRAL
ncbi:hypothetical protein FACS1894140_5520 [Spirochaetia bacterium]|nr:hypothetical protein FACS1894140_5520 [Spirochaetia bacterium]